jgi:NAD(P)H-quinone oxidoreductase subunit 5
MNALFGFSIALVPALLLAQGLAPAQWVNRHPRITARWNFALVLAALAVCLWGIGWMAVSGPVDWRASISRHGLSLGIWFDPLAAVMMLLIGLIGLVITRYSLRYLDGEPTQGRFLRWLGFTLGAVLLLVVSRNLLMLAGAWMLTSFGLHQLLTHYPHRPGALTAARKKFLISRIGDALLLAALWLTYVQFGSFEYADVFAALDAADGTGAVPLIGVLFVLGAMTKSAQFPFHSWLPDTMEAPTPVSALMHAGIINAGGFLVLRLSPLISRSQAALDSLVLVGAFTALFGAAVMMTQTSIKRSLAYSTIAQMGFMMLQCGLGAYSAALLHIVAHSLYKAHAFLSSGSVVEGAAPIGAESAPGRRRRRTAVPGRRAAAVLRSGAAVGRGTPGADHVRRDDATDLDRPERQPLEARLGSCGRRGACEFLLLRGIHAARPAAGGRLLARRDSPIELRRVVDGIGRHRIPGDLRIAVVARQARRLAVPAGTVRACRERLLRRHLRQPDRRAPVGAAD